MTRAVRKLPLFWRILLSISAAITALFVVTGAVVQDHVLRSTTRSLEEEVAASFQAYESLWRLRADRLRAICSILSSMSDVRAAFSTGDQNTIRDTAGELWARISEENAVFLVTDPRGRPIASLGGMPEASLARPLPLVQAASRRFPSQASGFMLEGDFLYQVVLTPVYVASGSGSALLNVLMAGYRVDHLVARHFKEASGGSEFLFLSKGEAVASTLSESATAAVAKAVSGHPETTLVSDGEIEYAPLRRPLVDIENQPIGELWILRSFEGAATRIAELRRDMIFMWIAAIAAGIGVSFLLARRIVEPVKRLDRAASEIARQNYDVRVRVESGDELGRLAGTFNAMCASIQSAREELIRQERISTIGRLSSSIVHDLRNPLAAIYGGAEMMVDTELPPQQVKRLAGNIYRASRRIQELLQDLVNVSRGSMHAAEMCRLSELISGAADAVRAAATAQNVEIGIQISESFELSLERARIERVFQNLFANALEAMPGGGAIAVRAFEEGGAVRIEVEDTGPGIPHEIRDRLFQPFATHGKKSGLGLGLALSRQTVADHGGELWVEPGGTPQQPRGAKFCVRLPRAAGGGTGYFTASTASSGAPVR